jgi:hypothetical protein
MTDRDVERLRAEIRALKQAQDESNRNTRIGLVLALASIAIGLMPMALALL